MGRFPSASNSTPDLACTMPSNPGNQPFVDTPQSFDPETGSGENQLHSVEDLLHGDLAPDDLRRSLIESITGFEKSFRKQFPLIWTVTLVGPMLFTMWLLVMLGMINDWQVPGDIIKAALGTFFVFGRFVILVGQDGQALAETSRWFTVNLTPGQLFGMLTYMDLLIALFVTFHMGILFRLPIVGQKIAGLASDGKFIMSQQPRLRRLAFFALIGLVIFPTSTTGSIGGSIFGRLLGLGRFRTIVGVATGSVLGNSLMYFFAQEINGWIGPDSFWLKMSGILVLVLGVMFVEMRYRKAKNRYLARLEAQTTSFDTHPS